MPDLIKQKRDGAGLTRAEIQQIIAGYTQGNIPDYQMSALLMAIVFNGLTEVELHDWTDAMLRSGEVLKFDSPPGLKVDKHSTGGVGDKISLCLAPAVAALGVPVPMISGRGLGHTGGTLDKLESIPGFSVNLSTDVARGLLEKHGLFLIGQTEQIAPADRKLYALRDVTGTVESIPLIASSIMSKKLAEGIDGLVLDVKVGDGAFMKNREDARQLARTLVGIGRAAGKNVRALLTDMNTPLGYAVGNALEVAEAIDVMKGEGPEDVTELTVELGSEMLCLSGRWESIEAGKTAMNEVLADGRALEKFAAIVEAQGGDPSVCDGKRLHRASYEMPVGAMDNGTITRVNPMKIARAALAVGAGRLRKEDAVDSTAGVTVLARPGDEVEEGQPLALLHHNSESEDGALGLLAGAFEISEKSHASVPLVLERM